MTSKSNPDPSDTFANKDGDPNTLPLQEEGSDSNQTPTSDLQKQSAGTGTIKVTG